MGYQFSLLLVSEFLISKKLNGFCLILFGIFILWRVIPLLTPMWRVTPLKTPFGLLIGFIAIFNHLFHSCTFVATITYSTLTRLHSLQTLHSNLHWLTSQLSITISNYHTLSHTQSLQFTLRADCDTFFVKLSPRSYSANSLLKTDS
jgi:hypothetical protein